MKYFIVAHCTAMTFDMDVVIYIAFHINRRVDEQSLTKSVDGWTVFIWMSLCSLHYFRLAESLSTEHFFFF